MAHALPVDARHGEVGNHAGGRVLRTGGAIRGRGETMCVLQVIVAVLLPPLAVLWKRGLGASFVLSIVLTILGYVPGLVYAIYVVLTGRD